MDVIKHVVIARSVEGRVKDVVLYSVVFFLVEKIKSISRGFINRYTCYEGRKCIWDQLEYSLLQ